MMKQKKALGLLLFAGLLLGIAGNPVRAAEADEDPIIVVSLGDSYSSGEGNEPFFGQNQPLVVKASDPDWLAHRSEIAWSGQLSLPGITGTLSDHRNENWYFVAASGATSWHLEHGFDKEVLALFTENRKEWPSVGYGTFTLEPQFRVFEQLAPGTVDYVTMTMGGNDIGFADIITSCAMGSTYLNCSDLSDKLNDAWEQFFEGGIRNRLGNAYEKIAALAGDQAKILIAGYPRLLDENGKGLLISAREAQLVNRNVTLFNKELADLVKEKQKKNINIQFIPVEAAFLGHGAYSKDPYINEIILLPREQDLRLIPPSAYSIHPNEKGVAAYAAEVQKYIDEVENIKSEDSFRQTFEEICRYGFYDFEMTMPDFHLSHPNTSVLTFYPNYKNIQKCDGYYAVFCSVGRKIRLEKRLQPGEKLSLVINEMTGKKLTLTGQADGRLKGSDGCLYELYEREGTLYLEYADASDDFPYQIIRQGIVRVREGAEAGYFMMPEDTIDSIFEAKKGYTWYNGFCFDEEGYATGMYYYGD